MVGLNPTFVDIETPDTRGLLELARAGDTEAFSGICRLYETRLLRQAMAVSGNATLAEELAEDTLVEAWKCLRRYNGRCEFFTWLCAILLNRHRNHLRKNRFHSPAAWPRSGQDEFAEAVATLADSGALPDEAAAWREQAALVRQCLEKLPAKQRQVVYLRFYVDDSLEGIAGALGCSVGTVKSRLFHALDRLRGMNVLNARPADLKVKG